MDSAKPDFSSSSKKRTRYKSGIVKKAVVIGTIVLGAAIGWNMLSDNNAPDPNDAAQQRYEEKRDEKLNVFHDLTHKMIDEYAANMADITDASRAGQYRNDVETNLETMLNAALIHDETNTQAPIQTAIADKNAISIARKWGVKVAFDDQLSEYGAVYHPDQKVIAVNANVPLEKAAIYARNALHHISFSMYNDMSTVGRWGGMDKRPAGAKLLMETAFAIDINALDKASVSATVLQGDTLPRNFNPPAPPLKKGPGM